MARNALGTMLEHESALPVPMLRQFFSGVCKPTKNTGKPQVFQYLELWDPSRSVLAPMYPTGLLVGDVLGPFWQHFGTVLAPLAF